ncbi:hypothetical protein CFE70_009789 [Pyrenophora teres f. teres 0-1]
MIRTQHLTPPADPKFSITATIARPHRCAFPRNANPICHAAYALSPPTPHTAEDDADGMDGRSFIIIIIIIITHR